MFWPGEFHGLYSLQGRRESDTTERLSLTSLMLRLVTAWVFSQVPLRYFKTGLTWSINFIILRKWQPTPVFLPREFHGCKSLVGYIQSMESQRVGQDWATNTFTFILIFKIFDFAAEIACMSLKIKTFKIKTKFSTHRSPPILLQYRRNYYKFFQTFFEHIWTWI